MAIIKTYENVCEINKSKYMVPIVKRIDIKILLFICDNKYGNNTKHWTETVKSEKACNGDVNLEANINEPKIEEVMDKESDKEICDDPYLLNIKWVKNINIVIA